MGLGNYAVGEMSSASRKLAICALVGRDQAEVARARSGRGRQSAAGVLLLFQ
jgi:hypothetical protein